MPSRIILPTPASQAVLFDGGNSVSTQSYKAETTSRACSSLRHVPTRTVVVFTH